MPLNKTFTSEDILLILFCKYRHVIAQGPWELLCIVPLLYMCCQSGHDMLYWIMNFLIVLGKLPCTHSSFRHTALDFVDLSYSALDLEHIESFSQTMLMLLVFVCFSFLFFSFHLNYENSKTSMAELAWGLSEIIYMKWLGHGKPSRNASTYTVPRKISVRFAVLEFCDSDSADGEGDPMGRLLPKGFWGWTVCVTTRWHTNDISNRKQVYTAGRCGGCRAFESLHFHF